MSVCHVPAPSTLPAQTTELELLPVAYACTAGLSLYRRRLVRTGSLPGTWQTMTQRAWLVSPGTSWTEKPLPRGSSVIQGAAVEEGLPGDTGHKQWKEEGRM